MKKNKKQKESAKVFWHYLFLWCQVFLPDTKPRQTMYLGTSIPTNHAICVVCGYRSAFAGMSFVLALVTPTNALKNKNIYFGNEDKFSLIAKHRN